MVFCFQSGTFRPYKYFFSGSTYLYQLFTPDLYQLLPTPDLYQLSTPDLYQLLPTPDLYQLPCSPTLDLYQLFSSLPYINSALTWTCINCFKYTFKTQHGTVSTVILELYQLSCNPTLDLYQLFTILESYQLLMLSAEYFEYAKIISSSNLNRNCFSTN